MPPGPNDHQRRTSIAWTLPKDQSLPSESRRSTSSITSSDLPPATSSTPNISTPSASSSTLAPSIITTNVSTAAGHHSAKSISSSGGSIRLGSPPPPPSFVKRVSFDTFDNKDATDFSLTLKSKHKDYTYSRRSRTFLCGTDQNDYSEFALEWLLDELVDDGDEIVCLRVVDKDSKISSDQAIQERLYRQEAEQLLEKIIEKNEEEKAISIILEFAVGKVHETIQRMIHIYEPVILIVGTRGRSLGGLQGLLPGSVSKYCLQHSPVPVIVVRPSSKRDKKKAKRKADPNRRVYKEILQQSAGMGLPDMLRPDGGSGTNATATPTMGMSAQTSPVEQFFPDSEKLFGPKSESASSEPTAETKTTIPATTTTTGMETPSPGTVTAVQTPAKEKTLEDTIPSASAEGRNQLPSQETPKIAAEPAAPDPENTGDADADAKKPKSNSLLDLGEASGA
ncbi:adenine nucleotide alpha hydrolases-like protein [Ascodesmis nigricans]|uniref:Adenine nucleotide alpha hydrolases-like protein n=1 Tax=Ascodesmis nigricans TaxID=341454 RepID=A0A4S2MZN7_9PEZI|nr:adenine nucleotide alpha hydrolases-like protein [Ascodesmis nigricans]